MDAEAREDSDTDLPEMRQIVARQAEQISGLQRRLANEHFAGELLGALTQAAVAGTIASPVSHARLLEMIVETAAHVIGARLDAFALN